MGAASCSSMMVIKKFRTTIVRMPVTDLRRAASEESLLTDKVSNADAREVACLGGRIVRRRF